MIIENPCKNGMCNKCVFVSGVDKTFCSVHFFGENMIPCECKGSCDKYIEKKVPNSMSYKEATIRLKEYIRVHEDGRPHPKLDEAVELAFLAMEKQDSDNQ